MKILSINGKKMPEDLSNDFLIPQGTYKLEVQPYPLTSNGHFDFHDLSGDVKFLTVNAKVGNTIYLCLGIKTDPSQKKSWSPYFVSVVPWESAPLKIHSEMGSKGGCTRSTSSLPYIWTHN
ncbi:hypothetical protein EHQ53_11165 [Leptospira langatensis]|uniref:Uncharacterized protein n=1 Tax=Leptospira langatensis TaxID=2484983 RepID=A0A5F1ZUC5_9LEPT|nr:hypothetical protein [Leptospira langatensis]TGJ98888.1 hypothetical protein EHO57_15335 [Leptospira langatensis]TGL40545.1 hypothetical protein EHQ53_11165 [Leptospira langatensis]